MRSSIIFVICVVLVVTGLLFAGKFFARRPEAGGTVSAHQDRFNGNPAPDFELKVLSAKGKTMRLSELKGKAVLINFWATWCEPCKVEMPWLVEFQNKYGPEGLQVIGVAMDDADDKTITAFTKKMGVNYPVLLGTEKAADLYGGIDGLPTLFFVDRSGKIVDHELGLRSASIIEDNIKKSLAQGAASSSSAP